MTAIGKPIARVEGPQKVTGTARYAGEIRLPHMAYATLIEPYWFQVRRVELRLRCWPRRLDGLTILHLSDLHVHARDPGGQVLVRRAARLPADIGAEG